MNKLLMIVILSLGNSVFAAGGMIGGGDGLCTEAEAVRRAELVTTAIAEANGYVGKQMGGNVQADEDRYLIQTIFDLGLSVPAYTVEVRKNDCSVQNVTYANLEG